MSWYVWLYIAALGALGLASAHDQYEEGRGWGQVVADVASSIILVYFVLAYFAVVRPLPMPLNVALAVFAIGWNLFDGARELRTVIANRPLSHDPELSDRTNATVDRAVEVFAGSAGIMVVLPAIAAAISVVLQSNP